MTEPNVRIEELRPMRVASFLGFGPEPETLAWKRLLEWARPRGLLDDPAWKTASPVHVECTLRECTARPELSTSVRILWSDRYLYLGYTCPYTQLTVFEPPLQGQKRFDVQKADVSLWDRDVVEAFIGTDEREIRRYAEFEVAPTNERLDLMITKLPEKDFAWRSDFVSAVKVDAASGVWTCEMRIPLAQLAGLLGFSEQSAMTRSCRRWFGVPPSALRRQIADRDPHVDAWTG